ncbi:unnamed protein product [Linum trigynum]|uniref:Uncharacterized protein n=1 Tax=Linum trigynum TaxID=586398 RepID=A0AAV2DDC0_9ROSI
MTSTSSGQSSVGSFNRGMGPQQTDFLTQVQAEVGIPRWGLHDPRCVLVVGRPILACVGWPLEVVFDVETWGTIFETAWSGAILYLLGPKLRYKGQEWLAVHLEEVSEEVMDEGGAKMEGRSNASDPAIRGEVQPRVFSMKRSEADASLEVVTSTILIHDTLAYALIDPGSTIRSFPMHFLIICMKNLNP